MPDNVLLNVIGSIPRSRRYQPPNSADAELFLAVAAAIIFDRRAEIRSRRRRRLIARRLTIEITSKKLIDHKFPFSIF